LQLNESGEPIYGERDVVDLAKLRELGQPFWLAGSYGSPEKLREALADGAEGIQVGSAFAFCAESGHSDEYKRAVIDSVVFGDVRVLTDPLASPTHFPFKVVQVQGSLSESATYTARPRICEIGYLREAYRTPDGSIGYRCAAEPVTTYAAKGGNVENTVGRKCLCNALLANIGLAQVRNGKYEEKGLITSGNDLKTLARYLPKDGSEFRARDVIAGLTGACVEQIETSRTVQTQVERATPAEAEREDLFVPIPVAEPVGCGARFE
jgi:NAD(P)H-dependent flavin oxidoreductase YrpB (nitropropane dioxygenase family)